MLVIFLMMVRTSAGVTRHGEAQNPGPGDPVGVGMAKCDFSIASWNCNTYKNLSLAMKNPEDIFCLQETRCDWAELKQFRNEHPTYSIHHTPILPNARQAHTSAGMGLATLVSKGVNSRMVVPEGVAREVWQAGRMLHVAFATGGEVYHIINFYGPQKKAKDRGRVAEYREALVEYLVELSGARVLLVGDYNDTLQGDSAFEAMLQERGYVDLEARGGQREPTYMQGSKSSRLDAMFASPEAIHHMGETSREWHIGTQHCLIRQLVVRRPEPPRHYVYQKAEKPFLIEYDPRLVEEADSWYFGKTYDLSLIHI